MWVQFSSFPSCFSLFILCLWKSIGKRRGWGGGWAGRRVHLNFTVHCCLHRRLKNWGFWIIQMIITDVCLVSFCSWELAWALWSPKGIPPWLEHLLFCHADISSAPIRRFVCKTLFRAHKSTFSQTRGDEILKENAFLCDVWFLDPFFIVFFAGEVRGSAYIEPCKIQCGCGFIPQDRWECVSLWRGWHYSHFSNQENDLVIPTANCHNVEVAYISYSWLYVA